MLDPVPMGDGAWICGLLAMAGLIAWPAFQSRSTMLTIQFGALTLLVLHYALIGVVTAAVMNALGATQIAVCLFLGTRPRLQWIGYALAVVMVAASIATWQGLVSALATAGMVLVAVGRVQTNVNLFRVIVLAGGPFWLAHDLLIASPVAAADALSLVIGLGALARQRLRPMPMAAKRLVSSP
ncbi:YgjV family protein [Hypericibacter sp.]|uniref:YgjV family protein n=1 Tax=Hypericibacter sp. TaxID=2705401 RepID=UPI003D6C9D47